MLQSVKRAYNIKVVNDRNQVDTGESAYEQIIKKLDKLNQKNAIIVDFQSNRSAERARVSLQRHIREQNMNINASKRGKKIIIKKHTETQTLL